MILTGFTTSFDSVRASGNDVTVIESGMIYNSTHFRVPLERISNLLKQPKTRKMAAALSFANERLLVFSVIDHELSLKMLLTEVHGVSP